MISSQRVGCFTFVLCSLVDHFSQGIGGDEDWTWEYTDPIEGEDARFFGDGDDRSVSLSSAFMTVVSVVLVIGACELCLWELLMLLFCAES